MMEPDLPRILVVDDEPFMRTTVKAMLRMVGRFFVQDAADGSQAMARVDEFHPHIIICDVSMTPMDGITFVRRLHEHPDLDRRSTAVIMLTSDSNETTILTAAKLQLAGYLVKPVSPKQLGGLVTAILRHLELLPA
jgi:two-component system chemotaxis response regulator CheY